MAKRDQNLHQEALLLRVIVKPLLRLVSETDFYQVNEYSLNQSE